MADQTRFLSVRAIMDAGGYEAGVRKITDGNKAVSASAGQVSAALEKVANASGETAGKLNPASAGVEKLKRQFIEGYAAGKKMEEALQGVSLGLELGQIKAHEAEAALTGIIQKYGQLTSVSQAASNFEARGQMQFAAAIELTNRKIQEQVAAVRTANATIVHSNLEVSASAEKFRRQVLGQQLLDVGQSAALGMPLGMVAMQQGPQIAGLYAGNGGMKNMLADFTEMGKVLGPIAVGLAAVYGAYKILDANSAAARLSVDSVTQALAAQAAPLSALEGQVNELAKIQKDYRDAILSTATGNDAATKSIIANSEQEFAAKKSLLELELKRQEAAQKVLESQIAVQSIALKTQIGDQFNQPAASPVSQGFADPKINGGIPFVNLPESISGMERLKQVIDDVFANNPAADSLKEMQANAALTQIAVDKLRESLGLAFNQVPPQSVEDKWREYAKNIQGLNDALHGLHNPPNVPLDRVPIPLSRPINGAGYPPIDYQSPDDKVTAKAESAYESLKRAADARIKELQQEIQYSGLAADLRARLLAQDQAEAQYRESIAQAKGKINADEIAALRRKADAQALLSQQLAGQKFDQGQADEIRALQLQADLIGKSVEEQNRANAVFQAEQQMRQQGLSLLDAEADKRREIAAAMADASTQIQRQQAAYQSLQQAQGSVIDDLITGTGTMQDRLKAAASDVLKWVEQMALANPLKNALTGTNLPTLADLFSGKPQVPNLTGTSTPLMNVTATTVMLNGGFPTGPGGALPTPGSLGELLGYKSAATSSATSAATAAAVNAAANQNTPTTDIAAYIRQAAIQRGIDPNTALAVARSEGGLTSWNKQSDVIMANGQREPSFGPFQLYKNGGLGSDFQRQTGLDPALAENGPRAVDYALDNAKLNGWTAFHGAANTGISRWQGIGQTPGIDPQTTNSVTNSFKALSRQTTTTTDSFTGLGDSTKTLQSSFADFLGGTKLPSAPGSFPAAPMGPGYFPPAPTAAFNPLAFFKSIPILGSIFSLFGFADGTDFAPGGPTLVGERGAEIVNLPRGSRVTPTHRLASVGASGGSVSHKHEYNITVSGNGDKDLMRKMTAAADEIARQHVQDFQRNSFNDAMDNYRQYPHERG